MLQYVREDSPHLWTEQHEKLANYFKHITESLSLSGSRAYRNEAWTQAWRQCLYHRLCAHRETDIPDGLNAFFDAFDHGVNHAKAIAEVMRQSGHDSDSVVLLSWVRELEKGLSAYKNNDYSGTLAFFEAALQRGDLNEQTLKIIYGWRSQTHLLNSQYDLALEDLESVGVLDSDNLALVVRRAEVFKLKGDRDRAIAEVEKAIAKEPNNAAWYAYRAGIYQSANDFERSLADTNKGIGLEPRNTWLLWRRSRSFLALGQNEEALADINQLILLEPADPWWRYGRAEVYAVMEDTERAMAEWDHIIRAFPEASGWRFQRAVFLKSMSHLDEALADLEVAIDLDPTYLQALMVRGQTLLQNGEPAQALIAFEQVLQYRENYAWAHSYRGLALHMMGRYRAALTSHNAALLNNDEIDNSYMFGCRGQTLLKLGRLPEALADFDRSIDIHDSQDWWYYKRSITHRLMENDLLAREDITKALEIAYNQTRLTSTELWYWRFNIPLYQAAGGYIDEAQKSYQDLLKISPPVWSLETGISDLRSLQASFSSDLAIQKLVILLESATHI